MLGQYESTVQKKRDGLVGGAGGCGWCSCLWQTDPGCWGGALHLLQLPPEGGATASVWPRRSSSSSRDYPPAFDTVFPLSNGVSIQLDFLRIASRSRLGMLLSTKTGSLCLRHIQQLVHHAHAWSSGTAHGVPMTSRTVCWCYA